MKEKVKSKSAMGMSQGQILTIIILSLSNLLSATNISIQAPFYPAEAMLKGATTAQVGFVFAVFHLTVFVASPIYGSLLGRISPKFLFTAGIVCTGACAILFGFLTSLQTFESFIFGSFLLRIIEAIGHSANVAASFTIITMDFPENFSTIFALLETTWGFGLILGPTLGGILYEFGGFTLPFFTMGSLLIVTSLVSTFFLTPGRNSKVKQQSKSDEEFCPLLKPKEQGFFSLVKIPGVALAGFGILSSALSIEFLQGTMEPFLRSKFGLSPMIIGFIFMIDGLSYSISAPMWGRLCDKWVSQVKFVMLAGCSLTFTGFLFIGPAPGVPLQSALWTTILGLVIYGFGVGASFVSSFLIGLEDSIASGFSDSVATYGLVSGMWVSFLSLGAFIGPFVGGILSDHFGFEMSTLFVLATQFLMGISTVVFIVLEKNYKSSKSLSRQSLLENEEAEDKLLSN